MFDERGGIRDSRARMRGNLKEIGFSCPGFCHSQLRQGLMFNYRSNSAAGDFQTFALKSLKLKCIATLATPGLALQ